MNTDRLSEQNVDYRKIVFITTNQCTIIQDFYKWVVQFQKLTRNLFLTLHGQNVHRQQRQLSKFRMRYQQFARSCLLRGRGVSFQDVAAAGKGFLCAPVWGVQVCDYSAAVQLQCTV